jgi:hypothetical protein
MTKRKRREKKPMEYRTKEERQLEVKKIIIQLTQFDLNIKYDPVKKLYESFKLYIREGERIVINIPFQEINRRIKGVLAVNKREEVTIGLLNEKFYKK